MTFRSEINGQSTPFPRDSWQHIAVTYDKADGVTFWINGQPRGKIDLPTDWQGFSKYTNIPGIGGIPGNSGSRLGGASAIDELRFYTRNLSAEEIQTIVSNTSGKYKQDHSIPFDAGDIFDLRYSRDGKLLLAGGGEGGYSGKVVLYDTTTGEKRAEIGKEKDVALCADLSADKHYVALGGPKKIVKVYSVSDGKMLYEIDKHTDWITALRFSPDGKKLATGDRNGGIHVWETEGGGIVYSLTQHKKLITELAWNDEGTQIASAAEDGKIIIWGMSDGFPIKEIESAHEAKALNRYERRTGVTGAKFLSDGRLVTVGRDRTLKIWSTSGEAVLTISDFDDTPVSLALSNDDQVAFVGMPDGRLAIFDLSTGGRSM